MSIQNKSFKPAKLKRIMFRGYPKTFLHEVRYRFSFVTELLRIKTFIVINIINKTKMNLKSSFLSNYQKVNKTNKKKTRRSCNS